MTDQKITLIIEAVNRADAALGDVRKYLKDGQVDTEKLNAKSKDLSATMIRLAASVVSVGAALAIIKKGISYLSQIETAGLGIASAFMTGGKYIDAASGKALAAQDALKAAQGDSLQIIKELQYANLQTIATLEELIIAYQTTLPVALAKGFNRQQVKDFTVAMVQAAGAIGLPMNQMAEETRSILTGAIEARTSRIATVLGLRNEDIAQYKGNANGLFNFLMDKLSAYRIAGIEAQKTWAGLWSNTKDIALQALGQGIQPLFDAVKYELTEITKKIVTIDEKTKSIKWDPEFLAGVEEFRKGVTSLIAELYRLGMLLDKFGGMHSQIGSLVPFTKPGVYEQKNAEWRARYMASEKAIQDMAMREAGWKPVTPDIDKLMRDAARMKKRIAEQMQINVGNPDEGTQQLLRYYREIDKAASIWQANKIKPDSDAVKALENLSKKWGKIELDLDTDMAKRGLDELGKKLIDIDKKVAGLNKEAAGLPTAERKKANEKVKTWAAGEREEAISDWNKIHLTEQVKAGEEMRKQADLTEQWIQKGLRETTEETKKELDRRKALREGEINARLSEIDLAEAEGKAHRETIAERIGLMTELGGVQEDYLAQLDKTKDPASWYAQTDAVNKTRAAIVRLRQEQMKFDPAGALYLSLKQTGEQLTDTFSQIDGVVKKTFDGLTDALTDFVMTGKLSFSDLANSIIRDMIRIAWQQSVTGPLAIGLGNILDGLFGAPAAEGSAGFNSTIGDGSFNPGSFTARSFHAGGLGTEPTFYRIVPSAIFDFAPRLHGGIGPREKAAIITDDEGIFTPGQMKALGRAGGGDTVININIDNKTGLPFSMRQTGMQKNEKQKTKDIFLELAYSDIDFLNHMKGALSR